MLAIFAYTLDRRFGGLGGTGAFTRNLMAGFDAIGVGYRQIPPSSSSSAHPHRFLSEQWHTLRLKDAQALLYPNYYLPPFGKHQAPSTVVVHDTLFKDVPGSVGRIKSAWLNFALGPLLRRANNIVFISEFSRCRYLEHFGTPEGARLWVIPNPIDEVSFALSPGMRPNNKPSVITISEFYPHKNLETFVRLANLFQGHANFIAIGRPPNKKQLTQLIVRAPDIAGALQHVEFTGYVPQMRLVELIRASAAFVFPSRYEGFGMPPVEAVAVGLPAIVSDLPPLRESLDGKAAFVSRVDDLKPWAAALESALGSPPSWNQRTAWSADVLRKFNRAVIAERYADVLRLR